ncbi:MAG: hypothetical protein ACE5K1_12175 [Acidiferrobacterales bacterium]
MSAFDKTCPHCGDSNAAGAVDCACGYVFNPLYLEDPQLALELALKEETLIEEYLAARAEQAIEAAHAAAREVTRTPQDERKATAALETQHAADWAQAELAEQCIRTAEAEGRLQAHTATPTAPGDMPVVGKAQRSWQEIIVAEALKAKSISERTVLEDHKVVTGTKPGSGFRAAQAARAEKVVASVNEPNTMKCPACGAAVSVAAKYCDCGSPIPATPDEVGIRRSSREQQRGSRSSDSNREQLTRKPR